MQLPKPYGICKDCQEHAPARQHRSGRWFVYCEHNRAGGCLEPLEDGTRRWVIYTPVSREAFLEQMALYSDRYAQLNGAPPATFRPSGKMSHSSSPMPTIGFISGINHRGTETQRRRERD